ncbi:malate dehydrogenase [uncultured Campylobacter sp.]|uniref:lactate/malate family dehydrogenase n=1 Tax=uncultured Campylobacter sp. TaxID=218934 RepID=UPI00261C9E69|nr:malate dehydrogenase [uncultured Campylobacter sp.]
MKIAIFGAGNIGAVVANDLIVSDSLSQKIDSIALVDAVEQIARGKALDLAHTAAVYERDLRISGSTEPGDIAEAGIVVITAGRARKAGQSREELFGSNAAIVAQCARDAAKYAPNSIIVVVTNPLDMMVYAALQASGFAKERVIGMAGELDGARLKFELARASGKEISSMRSAIVGPHSEEMIALKNELGFEISDEIFDRAVQNVKRAGTQIGELLGTSAYLAPAAGIVKIIKYILFDTCGTLACCVADRSGVPLGRFVSVGKMGAIERNFAYSGEFYEQLERMRKRIAELKF